MTTLTGKLRQLLAERFSQEELRTLFFDLNVEYDDLPGRTRVDKARELVAHLQRRRRVDNLLAYMAQNRPDLQPELEALEDAAAKQLDRTESARARPNKRVTLGALILLISVIAVLVSLVLRSTAPDTPIEGQEESDPTVVSRSEESCLEQYFVEVAEENRLSAEVGGDTNITFSASLLEDDVIGPFGVRLTENGQTIGGLQYLVFPASRQFKVTSVVDADCQAMSGFGNLDRPSLENSLENWNSMGIDLPAGSFRLKLGRNGAFISNSFRYLR
jgi:hypothetical protein